MQANSLVYNAGIRFSSKMPFQIADGVGGIRSTQVQCVHVQLPQSQTTMACSQLCLTLFPHSDIEVGHTPTFTHVYKGALVVKSCINS